MCGDRVEEAPTQKWDHVLWSCKKGSTIWVTRRGELWRCNKTQVFCMSNLEAQGIPQELLRAKEKLRFHPDKLGFIDVEQEGDPPQHGEGAQAPARTASSPPDIQRKAPGTPRAPGTSRTTAPQTPTVLQGPPEGLRASQSTAPASAPQTPGIARAAPSAPIPPAGTPARARTPEPHARSRSPAPRLSPQAEQEQTSQALDTPAGGVREADELWMATVENQLARSNTQTPAAAAEQQAGTRSWRRFDFEAKRFRGSNLKGPLWSDVHRRPTLDLDTNKVIEDLTITSEMRVHQIHGCQKGSRTSRPP